MVAPILDCRHVVDEEGRFDGRFAVGNRRFGIGPLEGKIPEERPHTGRVQDFSAFAHRQDAEPGLSDGNVIPDGRKGGVGRVCRERDFPAVLVRDDETVLHGTLNFAEVECRSVEEFLRVDVPIRIPSFIARTERFQVFLGRLGVEILVPGFLGVVPAGCDR